MSDTFEVRDNRNKAMFRVDDEYLNGYSKLCGTNATLVYFCLCRHADRNQESFPSVEKMAEKLSISKRSVIRGIQTLVSWNIISKERERRKDATWLNNRYILLDKSVWESKPSATQPLGKTVSQVLQTTEPSATDDQSQVPQVHTKDTHKKDTHKKEAAHDAADVVLLLEVFSILNPSVKRMYGNTTQRKACRFLIDTYGLERVKSIAEKTLPKTNGLQYFPTITTPCQLQDNWVRLESAVRKYQAEKKSLSNKNKVAF